MESRLAQHIASQWKNLDALSVRPRKRWYVYVLMAGEFPRYVGSTCHLLARVDFHARTKTFDRYVVFDALDEEEARRAEEEIIKEFRPPLNVVGNPDQTFAQSISRKRPPMLGPVLLPPTTLPPEEPEPPVDFAAYPNECDVRPLDIKNRELRAAG